MYDKYMDARGSARRKNFNTFKKVITLRKQGLSYSEIKKETGVAKSTINNWLTYAGLVLSKKHLQIQTKKRVSNQKIATEASKITRIRKKEIDINNTINKLKLYFDDPFFNYCLALFESEGSKSTNCKFSNSDYRLIKIFVKFIEKYFSLNRNKNMTFGLYIHETRMNDLDKIKRFWSNKIQVTPTHIRIYWKKNKVTKRRKNPDYVGQMSVSVHNENILGSKLSVLSDIILKKYLRS